MKFNKGIVVLVIVMNVLFAIAVLFIFYHTSNEPSALIAAWFGFTTVELWALKEIKVKENESTYQSKRKKVKATDK